VNRRRLLLAGFASAAVVGAVYAYALPQLASYASVWRLVRGLGGWWIAGLLAVTAVDLLTYALPWLVALPGLRLLEALKMTQASTAFGLVMPGGAPLGMAASFAMLRSRGFSRSAVTSAVALTGLWSQVSTFLFPVVGLALLAAEGTVSATLRLLAGVGLAVSLLLVGAVVGVLWRAEVAARAGDRAASLASRVRALVGRAPVGWNGGALARYRAELLVLLHRRWRSLTVATLANQLTGYLMLELSIRAVGIDRHQVAVAESFAAWSIGRLLSSLPITPGGLGFVELGLTGTLVGFGGPSARVVAAVLVYRVLSIVPTLALGLLATLTWRRHQQEPLADRSKRTRPK